MPTITYTLSTNSYENSYILELVDVAKILKKTIKTIHKGK